MGWTACADCGASRSDDDELLYDHLDESTMTTTDADYNTGSMREENKETMSPSDNYYDELIYDDFVMETPPPEPYYLTMLA